MPTATVVDESIWKKAKKAARKEGHGDNYAYVTAIYKSMGGRVARVNPDAAAEWLRAQGVSMSDDGDILEAPVEEAEEEYVEALDESPAAVEKRLARERLESADWGDMSFQADSAKAVRRLKETKEGDLELSIAAADEIRQGRPGESFSTLLSKYLSYIRAMAFKYTRSKALAEEVTSRVVERLGPHRSKNGSRLLRGRLYNYAPAEDANDGAFSAWLRQVVRSEALDTFRHDKRTSAQSLTSTDPEDGGQLDVEAEDLDPYEALEREQEQEEQASYEVGQRTRAWRKVEPQLTEKERIVLLARHPYVGSQKRLGGAQSPAVIGASYQQIADQTGFPIGSVMRLLYTARQKYGELSGVVLPKDSRGRKAMRKNPMNAKDILYIEIPQDAVDLYNAGLLSRAELQSVLEAFNV